MYHNKEYISTPDCETYNHRVGSLPGTHELTMAWHNSYLIQGFILRDTPTDLLVPDEAVCTLHRHSLQKQLPNFLIL